jgi:hypothetical protein
MRLNRWMILGLMVSMSVACRQYKGAGFNQGTKDGAQPSSSPTASSGDGGAAAGQGPSAPAEPNMPKEVKVPTEAQVDGKTFIALTDEEALHGLKEGEEQIKIVCDRNAGKMNMVIKAFCVDKKRPTNIVELKAALGLSLPAQGNQNGNNSETNFVFQGHSSSLVGKFVSPINPRLVIFTNANQMANANATTGRQANEYVVMAFVRGEQFAEIAVGTANSPGGPEFFLVGFKQACNAKPEHCSPGELLTPAVESNWTSFTLFQDEDLKNSIVDCRHCHQPQGPSSQKILRMQELVNPWTHWFRDNTDGNQLITQYYAAHGQDEVYAGVPGVSIRASDPARLEDLVRDAGFANQPNEFPTNRIRNELAGNNGLPLPNGVWQGLFNRVLTGEMIPVPYHGLNVADPALQAKFTKQYQDFKAGTVSLAAFEDHRNIYPSDQKLLGDMGFAVAPTYDAQQTMMLACSQCHTARLDQGISRSRFNVDLTKMSAAGLDIAISRVKLGYSPARLKQEGIKILTMDGKPVEMDKGEHLLTMPPRRFKQLTDEQIDALVKLFEAAKVGK